MSELARDLRFSLRTLRASPVFTAVAIVSLALGIGCNSAIFSLLDQVLLRRLPIRQAEQLVMLDGPGPNRGSIWGENSFSYPMYRDFRDRLDVFSGVLARYGTGVHIAHGGSSERAQAELISGNYFEVLGLKPLLGRSITAADDRLKGGHPVAVLTFGYWQRRFGGNPGILQQTIRVNDFPFSVIGIAPPGFRGMEVGAAADLMVPMSMKQRITPTWDALDDPRTMWLHVFARLRPEIPAKQAEASANVLYRQILLEELRQIEAPTERFRKGFVSKHLFLRPGKSGRSELRTRFSTPLVVLMAMVGLVLLIACANVANLLIARAAVRQKEIAVRLALGASRAQIVRQLLVESTLLAGAGGVLGLLVAVWTGDLLLGFLPMNGAQAAFTTAPDPRVLGFTFVVSLLAGLLFGLVPALQATRPQLAPTLKAAATNLSPSGGSLHLRKGLVVAQIALSLLLLIGAGLFTRSLYNLRSINPGFDTTDLISFAIDPSLNGFTPERTSALYDRLQQEIAALPGVRSVSLSTVGLLQGNFNRSTVTVEGYRKKEGDDMNPQVNSVGPGFFRTIGQRVLAGREFTREDLTSPEKVVVNESFVRFFFADQNPIGRRIGFGLDRPTLEIVGVVADDRSQDLREKVLRNVFSPYPLLGGQLDQSTFYVRITRPAMIMAPILRATVHKHASGLPVNSLKTVEDQLSESLFMDRLVSSLSAFFGLLATVLAAIGLYGVMAYNVARRTREIGIRIALGASRGNVMWLVMREVTLLSTIGIAIGFPAALVLGRLIESQLFELSPTDSLTLTAATALLGAVALISGYLPARSATAVDPMLALRFE